MDRTRRRILPALLATGLCAAIPAEERAAADLVSWVKKRAEEVQPSREEKALDRIGWAPDVRAAERLSRESKRPVFLFTHDGRINTGRC
jgi:hypothetical protein